MREAQQGSDKPVSSVIDNWRNQVDRYEDATGLVTLKVTRHRDSHLNEAQIEAWYWERVGVLAAGQRRDGWEVDADHPAQQVYDGAPCQPSA
jgi:hypothetical protein